MRVAFEEKGDSGFPKFVDLRLFPTLVSPAPTSSLALQRVLLSYNAHVSLRFKIDKFPTHAPLSSLFATLRCLSS